ncbi:carbonic anhydrase [Corynebacterium anserum]|nr:carbonic anhydrase [Corynebacterium anserum]
MSITADTDSNHGSCDHGQGEPTQLTPRQAWEALEAGNRRFVEHQVDHPRQDGATRDALNKGQNPHAVVLACSDSRVPVEIVFDQGLGDVFVIRTAGEITDLSVLASLEFAVDSLGVPLVVVLGHEKCGAVAASERALNEGVMPNGFQRVLVEKVTPSLLSARAKGLTGIENFERNHVAEIANHIVDRSPEIRERIVDGRVAVVGLRYRLEDGQAEPLVSYGLDIGGETMTVDQR